VTRIVAGAARGRRLKVPPALTRPTSDRVREAVFSSLESVAEIAGASVLDLFAGSGALGLEALSRGASLAVLVDRAPAAAKVMAENVVSVGLPGAQIVRRSVGDYLRGTPAPFDLVLLDPPYEFPGEQVSALVARLTQGWLAPAAVVVVERGAADSAVIWPDGFTGQWHRRFGGTHVLRAVWYGHEQGST
jgi:16S rRNA (guanine966-N2)-methyltransferase